MKSATSYQRVYLQPETRGEATFLEWLSNTLIDSTGEHTVASWWTWDSVAELDDIDTQTLVVSWGWQ